MSRCQPRRRFPGKRPGSLPRNASSLSSAVHPGFPCKDCRSGSILHPWSAMRHERFHPEPRPSGSRPARAFHRPLVVALAGMLASCNRPDRVQAKDPAEPGNGQISVGVAKVVRKTLERTLDLSSELVPFQEIDVYAKESGFVKD